MAEVFTILVDTRERQPLQFPDYLAVRDPSSPEGEEPRTKTVRLVTVSAKLETGDYALEGHRGACLIERKGSLLELHKNLHTKDVQRFREAATRLAKACTHPYLLLEGDPSNLLRRDASGYRMGNARSRVVSDPGVVVDTLLQEVNALRIGLLWLPSGTTIQRRAVGEWAARLLLAPVLLPER